MSIFILAQSGSIKIDDVWNMNEMVKHFQYHDKNYGDDLFTFFSKHYGGLREKHSKNHKKEDHNQLPFDHSYNFHSLTTFIIQKVKDTMVKKNMPHKQTSQFFYLENYTSIERSDIFQPPI